MGDSAATLRAVRKGSEDRMNPLKAYISVTIKCPRCGQTMYHGPVKPYSENQDIHCSNNDCPIAYKVFQTVLPLSVLLFDQKRLFIPNTTDDIGFDEGAWTASSGLFGEIE